MLLSFRIDDEVNFFFAFVENVKISSLFFSLSKKKKEKKLRRREFAPSLHLSLLSSSSYTSDHIAMRKKQVKVRHRSPLSFVAESFVFL